MIEQVEKPPGQHQSKQARSAIDEKLTDPGWAWAVYQPNAQQPWNLIRAGHLFRRATFGAGWEQLQQALSDGPQRTIDKLLKPQADTTAFNNIYDGYDNSAAGSIKSLRAWWLRRIIQTPHPLLEKMTLFWHSHFATNSDKVKNPRLMLQHIQLLRSHALSSFQDMLQAISHDPAVLIYLGADANRKALPNENFARPLMENFTMGPPGNYKEKDVREAARAFTGWFVLRSQLRYISREHDGNIKEVLGERGNFTGDDVVRIALKQPATSRMLVRKLYRWLICETEEPNAAMISPLAETFAKDYDIMKLTETMLRSNLFFSQAAYRRRIKSPIEFALGIVHALEGVVSTTQLEKDLAGLGQNLYNPPTANGWAGGRNWIDSATLTGRSNLALSLLLGSGPYGDKLNPRVLANKHGCTTLKSAGQLLLDLFLQSNLAPDVHQSILKTVQAASGNGSDDEDATLRRFAHIVVTLPEFHLA
ncbi:MAG: DUF1800 domain-containing protein [Planctomycetes bacterium]|nr:DUF1800 domain-containing protein [Planctomycetota bacterium]